MGITINDNEKFSVLKGNTLFQKGEGITKICILLNGQVSAKNEYMSMTLGNGSVIGLIDAGSPGYIFDYEAITDVKVLMLDYTGNDDIKKIFARGTTFQDLATTSVFGQFLDIYRIYQKKIEPFVMEVEEINEVDNSRCEYLMDILSLKKDVFHGMFVQGESIPYMHICMIIEQIQAVNEIAVEVQQIMHVETKDIQEELREFEEQGITVADADAIEELKDATSKILRYSEMDSDKATKLHLYIVQFQKLSHKDSLDESVRELKSKIAELYYEVYEKVFFKAYKNNEKDKLIMLFLNFGFMDETGFTNETLTELYNIRLNFSSSKYSLYTIYDWLCAIYEGRRQPSKNEFDMDYKENLRELKRSHKFTAQAENEYLNNMENKVHFEIANLFRITNKLTSGQITRFCPILNQQEIIRSLSKLLVDARKVETVFDQIREIDYSLFYREHMYYDEANKISKTYVMKEVLPDIILMPNVGSRAIMWQDIADNRRDNPARFVFPIFTIDNLSNMATSVFGTFRWELCKTIQGSHWNDVRDHSLTSEYCDYAQFYRKNKELSEDAKAKVKSQYQRCKNSYREMFVSDYDTWIKYESNGSIRLNKCVRKIMLNYVPFAKKYRDKISAQPIFTEGMAAFTRTRNQRLKEIKNEYKLITNNGGQITQTLIDNQKFYEEL